MWLTTNIGCVPPSGSNYQYCTSSHSIPALFVSLISFKKKDALFTPVTRTNWPRKVRELILDYDSPPQAPCAEIDKNIVPVTGARQFMSNNPLLLQKLPEAHKVVLCSPSPFNKNTHPLIYLRDSSHQKSESV